MLALEGVRAEARLTAGRLHRWAAHELYHDDCHEGKEAKADVASVSPPGEMR